MKPHNPLPGSAMTHVGFTEEQDAAVERVVRRSLSFGLPPSIGAGDVRQTARLAILEKPSGDPFEVAKDAVRNLMRQEIRWKQANQEITPEIESELKDEPVVCIDVGPYLDLLNFDEGLAVELRCIEGWAYAEIACALGTSEANAWKLVSRGLARIKKFPR